MISSSGVAAQRPKFAGSATEKETTSQCKRWKCGPAFVVPFGSDMSDGRARLLGNKIKDFGGTLARTAREADVVIVDPSLSREVLKREFLRDKIDSATKVTIDWLNAVLFGKEWIDPHSEDHAYHWHGVSEQEPKPSMQDVNVSLPLVVASQESASSSHGWHETRQEEEDSPRTHAGSEEELTSNAGAGNKKLNDRLINEMSKMAEMYSVQGEKWRAKAYAQVAAIVKTLDFELNDSRQIRHRKGIGPKMAAHIDEILRTGEYSKRIAFEADPRTQALVKLTKIFGVGKATAHRLHQWGYRDVDAIRRALATRSDARLLSELHQNQLIGIKYYEELEIRIKRAEIEAIRDIIRRAVKQVYPLAVSEDLLVEATGSYRRGKETCGDCDILFSLPSRRYQRVSLAPLVAHLVSTGFMVESLSTPYAGVSIAGKDDDAEEVHALKRPRHELVDRDYLVSARNASRELESETFMGICLIPPGHPQATGVHHRIDLKSYAFENYPFALLYFTGSALFSRNMRKFANDRGLKLTDRGLYPLMGEHSTSSTHAIRCDSEQEIFQALGLEYKEPKDRNYDEVEMVIADDYRDEDHDEMLPNKKHKVLLEDDDDEAGTFKLSEDREWDEEKSRRNAAVIEGMSSSSSAATMKDRFTLAGADDVKSERDRYHEIIFSSSSTPAAGAETQTMVKTAAAPNGSDPNVKSGGSLQAITADVDESHQQQLMMPEPSTVGGQSTATAENSASSTSASNRRYNSSTGIWTRQSRKPKWED